MPDSDTQQQTPTPTAGRSAVLRFTGTATGFLIGLVIAVGICDAWIGAQFKRHNGRGVFAGEVYSAIQSSEAKSRRVTNVFLGDSVARQLLRPGTEPSQNVRFLTTNQAVSLAGQYYLVENSLRAFPNLTDVYLLYTAGCFVNNLPPELSHDYFCAFFHKPRQVAEVFSVKQDLDLSAAHLGRMLVPNLMIANSGSRPASAGRVVQPTRAANATFAMQAAPESEPLLSLLDRWFGSGLPEPTPQPAGSYGAELPPVSRYFLARMRDACRARGVTLHVLPPPLSTAETFQDPLHIYDATPLRVSPNLLIDPVHFQQQYVNEYRKKMSDYYKLPLATPSP